MNRNPFFDAGSFVKKNPPECIGRIASRDI